MSSQASKKRFVDFVETSKTISSPRNLFRMCFLSLRIDAQIKKSQKEKQFLQSCRGSTLDKQQTIKAGKPELKIYKLLATCLGHTYQIAGGHHQVLD